MKVVICQRDTLHSSLTVSLLLKFKSRIVGKLFIEQWDKETGIKW